MYDLLTLRKNKSLMYRLQKDYRIVGARGGASILGLAVQEDVSKSLIPEGFVGSSRSDRAW